MKVSMKQGAAKTLTFTYTDSAGNIIDVSACTFTLAIRKRTEKIFEIADAGFDKTEGAAGKASCVITATMSDIVPMLYVMEIKCVFDANNVDKSDDIDFEILRSTT